MKKRIVVTLLVLCFIGMLIPAGWSEAASIKMSPKKVSMYAGDTYQLTLKGVAGSIKWSSEDKTIATVTKKGVVKGVNPGKVKINAKFMNKTYTCTVTIKKPQLNFKKKTVNEGETFQLELYGIEAKSYSSSDKDVATVSETGEVKALELGNAVINVVDIAGNKYKCKLTVLLDPEAHVHTKEFIIGRNPTCTEPGLTNGKRCTTCGEILEEQTEIPPTGHSFFKGVCSICGEKDPNYVPPHEHTYETVNKAPTCTEPGHTDKVYCSGCGEVFLYPKTIPALGHDYFDGYCTRCGVKEVHEYVITQKGTPPTCTSVGWTDRIECKYCGDVKQESEEIPELGHNYDGDYCTRCGADIYGHIHEWHIDYSKAPTCSEPGHSEGKYCLTCGYVEKEAQFIPRIPHNFVNGKCTRCGTIEGSE